jgi:hypothetical protein
MVKVLVVAVLTIATIGLSACAAAAPAETPAQSPAPTPSTSPAVSGDAILIETRITDARAHTGEVLVGSVIGEAEFCTGGVSSGSSQGPTITTIFTCPEGTLTVHYAPTQFSLVQGAPWEIVSGTGGFEGLIGGGSMVAAFDSDNPDSGREIFTGTVSS